MSKRLVILSVFALLAFCCGMSSCAKKEGIETPFTKLLGTWQRVNFATDDNNNGVIDSWEIFAVQPDIINTIEFKKDSTGVEKTTYSPDLNFRWEIVGDQSVRLSYNANDTVLYTIAAVNSGSLNLTTHTTLSLAGYYYKKK